MTLTHIERTSKNSFWEVDNQSALGSNEPFMHSFQRSRSMEFLKMNATDTPDVTVLKNCHSFQSCKN